MPIEPRSRSGAAVAAFAAAMGAAGAACAEQQGLAYPAVSRSAHVDVHHGVAVPDPYRSLEDMDSAATRSWIRAQNDLTDAYLDAIPERARIEEKLLELSDFPTYSRPTKAGGRYFYVMTPPGGVGALFVQDDPGSEPRKLADPNDVATDGSVTLGLVAPSRDGRLVAVSMGSGSVWQEVVVLDVETGRPRPDRLAGMTWASSVAWTADGSGFYYMRFDAPEEGEELDTTPVNSRVMFHRLGAPQSRDRLIYARPDRPKWRFTPLRISDDGRFLMLTAIGDSAAGSGLFFEDLSAPGSEVKELVPVGEESHGFVGSHGEAFWVRTTADAPAGRLVRIDAARPAPEGWHTIIPERPGSPLVTATVAGDRFVCWYTADVKPRLEVFDLEGVHVDDVELPSTTGYLRAASLRGTRHEPELVFDFWSTSHPPSIHRYDTRTGRQDTLRAPEALPWNPGDVVIRQEFFTSADGTRIPMFLIHAKDVTFERPALTYMPGYGAGGWIMNTGSSALALAITMLDGLVAIPGLRGGGEYGVEWHRAGARLSKQNTFDDYIAAAEWLVARGYSDPERLIAQGLSAGGAVPAVAVNQRPDLFGMSWPQWPVTDMIRFPDFTGGHYWTGEYGDPANPGEFEVLLSYSPVHNVAPDTCYPPTFVVAGEKDQAAVPMHAYKYVAALQEAQSCDNPILLDVVPDGGHLPSASQFPGHAADWLAFATRVLDLDLVGLLGD